MKVIETDVLDVYILEPQKFGDHRGWFMESWSKSSMENEDLYYDFVQDNCSFSAQKGTLRGLHLQNGADSQAKLVSCRKGAVLDVAVDLRIGSPTYKKWVSVELSAENNRQLLIPRGFAHGFLTITDDVEFTYKVDNIYAPQSDRSIIWNDPELSINWELNKWGINEPILSSKDANALRYSELDINFIYEKVD